jgi:hypothetical protein
MKFSVLFLALSATVSIAQSHPIDGDYKLVGGRNRAAFQSWKQIDPKVGDVNCQVEKSVLHVPQRAQVITVGKVNGVETEERIYKLKVKKGPGPFDYEGTTLDNKGFHFKKTSVLYGYIIKQTEEWKQSASNPNRATFEVRDPYIPIQSDCYYQR